MTALKDAYETLLCSVEDGVATVTFNRPEVRNAMGPQSERDLAEVMWALEADEAIRVIVLTGAGTAFCAGYDLSAGGEAFGAAGREQHHATVAGNESDITDRFAWWSMRTPIIAAINGAAIGAGLTMALLTDISIVAADATLAFPFVQMNLVPEANSTWLLPRLVGVPRAMEMVLTGRRFTGADAAAMGLVSRAVEKSHVLATAQGIAREVAVNTAPLAVGVTKQLLYEHLQTLDRHAAMTRETRTVWWLGQQPDTAEGVLALAQKREPKWLGSKVTPLP